jgi:hypothetical protein
VSKGVIGLAALRVGEHLIGLGRLFELLLGLGVVLVDIGMQLAGKARNAFFISVSPAPRATPRTS